MRSLLLLGLLGGAVGCASASPFLSPVRALRPGRVVADLGMAYQAPTDVSALRAAQAVPTTDGAIRRVGVEHGTRVTGVMPYAAVRAGVGGRTELTLAALGPTARLGVRRELYAEGNWVAAAGAHVRAGSWLSDASGVVPGLTIERSRIVGGEGFVFGGYVRREIYDLWFGPRIGSSYATADLTSPTLTGGSATVSATRLDVSLVLGLRINYGHIAVGVELEGMQSWAWGHDGLQRVSFSGFSVIPATALSWQF